MSARHYWKEQGRTASQSVSHFVEARFPPEEGDLPRLPQERDIVDIELAPVRVRHDEHVKLVLGVSRAEEEELLDESGARGAVEGALVDVVDRDRVEAVVGLDGAARGKSMNEVRRVSGDREIGGEVGEEESVPEQVDGRAWVGRARDGEVSRVVEKLRRRSPEMD